MIPLSEREQIVGWVDEARERGARLHKACEILGIHHRTLQRWLKGGEIRPDKRLERKYEPPNKLSPAEREDLLQVANSEEFAHLPPSQIVPILADQGKFIASESTFYRVLCDEHQLEHRHASQPKRERSKPLALSATGPNQVYSWDITYMPTTIKGLFFYLYLFMDVFSRKIVGWQVYSEESNEWASEIIQDIYRSEGLMPGQVTLHSDNGGPMKGATMLATLQRLGVVPSFSRPSVSNDNPYSESLFKTLKYRPEYPQQRFASLHEARNWVTGFVDWYNHEHRHSQIQFVTPEQKHKGLDSKLLQRRVSVYETAKATNPQRWSGETRNWKPVTIVHLNPITTKVDKSSTELNIAA